MTKHFILFLFTLPFSSHAAVNYSCTLGIFKKNIPTPLSEQTLNYKYGDPKNTLQVKLHGFDAIVESSRKKFSCPEGDECLPPEAGIIIILQHKGLRAQTSLNLGIARNNLSLATKDMVARMVCSQQPSKSPVAETPYSPEN